MTRWSTSRVHEWKSFCRALGRMGQLLARDKAPAGSGYVAPRRQEHPLLDIVTKARDVIAAIGEVKISDREEKSVLSWASVAQSDGSATIRLNHKGTKARSQQALDAAIDALRSAGRRVGFRDMIRAENQNGYLMLIRVRDAAPALGFAR